MYGNLTKKGLRQILKSTNLINLEKMIDFLEKLPESRFDFNQVRCGTLACVVGYFPEIFPGEVSLCSTSFFIKGSEDKPFYFSQVAGKMLNLPDSFASRLLSPVSRDYTISDEIPTCGTQASPLEVASMLKVVRDIVVELNKGL